jgi:hypothetical protein
MHEAQEQRYENESHWRGPAGNNEDGETESCEKMRKLKPKGAARIGDDPWAEERKRTEK